MLDNGITSLTCIHCEAGIKPGTQRRGKNEKKEQRMKEGRRDCDEKEMIKKLICCLSVAETEALGTRGGMGRGGRDCRRICRGREVVVMVVVERFVFNPLYLISFAVSESSRG